MNNALRALGRLPAGQMNQTEKRYSLMLEARKQAGEILWWAFEPMNLRLAPKCYYAVDFMVMLADGQLQCHEVKGGLITDDSLVKTKTAAEKFPFQFIMAMYKKKVWEYRYF